jgi:hypothetical protein
VGKPEEKNQEENLELNRRILKWILKKQNGKFLTGFIWHGIGTSGGLL